MRLQRVLAVAVVFLFLVGLGFGQTQGRTEHYRFTATDTAYYMGSCPNGFDILNDYVALMHGNLRYDKDGNPVQERYQFRVLGQSIYYNSTDPDKFVLGGPGEASEARIMYEEGTPVLIFESGLLFKVMLKGYGPIFLNTGHDVFDLSTGELLFKKGPDQYWTRDFEALCNALK